MIKINKFKIVSFLVLFSSFLGSCSLFEKSKPLTCPSFLLNRDTAQLVMFKDGEGRDITDEILNVEVLGYDGECKFNSKSNTSEVSFRIFVEAELGPAAISRKQKVSYFVAIPEFFPKKEGKKVLTLNLEFPENMDVIRFRDEDIKISIPLKGEQEAQDIDVYYGLQLTKEQLNYNRKMRK